ncbi:MAG: hypothetical protein ACEPOV_11940 [Hyphomicrobiales bacterium]
MKELKFKKEIIASLDNLELNNAKGGRPIGYTWKIGCSEDLPCITDIGCPSKDNFTCSPEACF